MLKNPPYSTQPPTHEVPDGLWRHLSSLTGEPQAQALEVDAAQPIPPWTGKAGPIASRSASPSGGRRFAALSTLPEGLRLPPKRDTLPARHQRETPASPADEVQELQLTSLRAPAPVPVPAPLPPPANQGLLPPPAARQMGFNCPGCFTVLIIRDPAAYDGRPAPCPTCGSRIVPPRVIPDSPFRIVER